MVSHRVCRWYLLCRPSAATDSGSTEARTVQLTHLRVHILYYTTVPHIYAHSSLKLNLQSIEENKTNCTIELGV